MAENNKFDVSCLIQILPLIVTVIFIIAISLFSDETIFSNFRNLPEKAMFRVYDFLGLGAEEDV